MAEGIGTALIYDFDGTLSRGNIQETSFIPDIGMSHEAFWTEVRDVAKTNNADVIQIYLYLMIKKANKQGKHVTLDMLRAHGERAPLFDGLRDKSWFKRINAFGHTHGLALEHYIISSGNQEMIEGCPIGDAFTKVYASKFLYEDGKAVWPAVSINYTTKTQYLFRINKGIDNHWDDKSVNQYFPEDIRPIPFERMIFYGDGDTDIPSMKMLTQYGGHAVAVYDPERAKSDLSKIHGLIADGRVGFVAPANYAKDSQLDIITKGILGRIAKMSRTGRA